MTGRRLAGLEWRVSNLASRVSFPAPPSASLEPAHQCSESVTPIVVSVILRS